MTRHLTQIGDASIIAQSNTDAAVRRDEVGTAQVGEDAIMGADEEIRATLERLMAQRDKLHEAIEALQRLLEGEDPEESTGSEQGVPLRTSSGTIKILPGEFFNQSQTDAAAAYLRKVKHAVTVDQILDALRNGGVKFEGSDPKTTLYTVLVRATKRFVLVSPNTFGLIEWYPDRPKKEKKKVKK